MKYKYVPKSKGPKSATQPGRPIKPDTWVCGPDPFKREKYYAWLKHRAQAKYRKESYAITWPQWDTLWSDDDFRKRGRRKTDLVLMKLNPKAAWSYNNCTVVVRIEYLKRAAEYRKTDD